MKMEKKTENKRKKDKQSDNEDNRREKKKSRKHRSRSRSRDNREKESRRKRKHSRSKSPNVNVKQEKRRENAPNEEAAKKAVPERKAKETDMLNTRTGGAYIPPARLRMMQAQITDKSSVAFQRLAWEALKKSIHGHINKINVGNIGIIIKELLKENIVRGRGLLCRSVIQAQAASPTFTNVYAALVAAVNSRFPNIGELLLKRLVIQFKRGFKRNDKPICISSASFIAHLVNQRVAHEILALELLTLLVESPTDDSVEVAIAFLKECGQKLTEVSSKGVNAIFEMLRNILHEGQLDKRVQYMIEVMFQVWKDGFKDHPALIEELELVPEEEQFTHLLMLDDATDPQDILNVFKSDDKYEENEQKYKTLSKEILGSDAESGEEDGSGESGSEESEDEDEQAGEQKGMTIIDNTETNLIALRRTIYLTINSSLDFEECAHKLMKMQLKPGQEVELCHMFLDCCAEQRTYEKFYGLLAQRFCNINRIYVGPFEEIFKDSYSTAHRLDTNRLRNVSKFFAHLLFTDSISWEVMECVKLNEEDTTSSSRIYIKILFQELAEYMGLKKLNDRLKDPTLQEAFSGIFPRDNPKNTRFSINFFTSIGLGGLTDELREHLKQMPKNIPAPITDINVESDSSTSSSSSSDSSSNSSSSDSEEENEEKKNKKKDKSKSNNDGNRDEEGANKDKADNPRWGHDGFYETYGKNARRHENRPERTDQDNFTRPRDRRCDDRENQNNDRRNRDERNNRDINGRRNERSTQDVEESRGHQRDSDDRRQERERPHEKRKDNTANATSDRNGRDDSRHEWSQKSRREREERRRDDRNDDSESRRESRVDDKRQDREQRRDRDNSNKDDSEKDKRDKGNGRNDKVREDLRNKDDYSGSKRVSRVDDKRQDREQRRDRDNSNKDDSEKDKRDKGNGRNDKVREDLRNKDDSKIPDRNSEKEKRDNDYERSDRVREDDRKKNDDKVRERNSDKQKRDKDVDRNDRYQENRNRDEGRIRERNSEREQRDKNYDRSDRNSDRQQDSNRKNRNKDEARRDEKEGRAIENREKDRNGTNKERKDYSSNDVDSRDRRKEDRSKTLKKDDETRTKKVEERHQPEDKARKNKEQSKDKKKRDRTNKSDEESSSSDSSSSDSSLSDSSSSDSENEKTGNRYWDSFDIEKPAHRDTGKHLKTPEIKEKRHDRRKER